jgi:hypothetical protein
MKHDGGGRLLRWRSIWMWMYGKLALQSRPVSQTSSLWRLYSFVTLSLGRVGCLEGGGRCVSRSKVAPERRAHPLP